MDTINQPPKPELYIRIIAPKEILTLTVGTPQVSREHDLVRSPRGMYHDRQQRRTVLP